MDSFHDQTTLSPDANHNQNVNTSNSQNVNMDTSVHAPPLDYKLIGDNLDKNIQARYVRLESHQNKSFHLFHLCAVRDRIDFSKIPNHHAIGCLHSLYNRALALLPTAENSAALRKNFIVLLSRLLTSNMKFFKFTCDGVIQWYINQKYSKEMATKSTIVSYMLMDMT